MCAETYSHLGPRGRIHNIERDVEKERTEVIVKFKANVLGAQSTVALFGWDFKELRLGCSNKERRVVKQRYEERLSAAKVAWEAAKHDSKSAFRAAERACEAAAPRRLGRARDEINGRSAKAGAQKKALKHLKSSLRVAEKDYSAEVSSAKDEEKDGLSRVRQDVCKNWDCNQRRLELVLDNVVSSGHASVERMVRKRSRRGIPVQTFAALPSCESVTLETICTGLVFLAALPQGALLLPSAKRLTLESTTSDAIAAVKAKTEADPEFDALSSNSGANHVEWDEVVHDNWRLGGGGDIKAKRRRKRTINVCVGINQ